MGDVSTVEKKIFLASRAAVSNPSSTTGIKVGVISLTPQMANVHEHAGRKDRHAPRDGC